MTGRGTRPAGRQQTGWWALLGLGVLLAATTSVNRAASADTAESPAASSAAAQLGLWRRPQADPAELTEQARLVLAGTGREVDVYRGTAQRLAHWFAEHGAAEQRTAEQRLAEQRTVEQRAAEEAAAARLAADQAAREAAARNDAAREAADRAEGERQAALEAARAAAPAPAEPSPPMLRTVRPPAPTPASAPAAGVEGQAEVRFLALVNEVRSRSGVGSLSPEGRLQASAQGWARQLAREASLHHQDVGQFLDAFTTAGENIAFGPSVDAVWSALVASPRHYDNIVKGEFSAVGIGVVVGSDGQLWTSHVFAG